MAWTTVAAVGSNLLGGLLQGMGGGEKTYVPRSSTKNTIRNNLNVINDAWFGPQATRPGAGVVGASQYGQGGLTGLYGDQANYPWFSDVLPFSAPNAWELGAVQGYGDFATQAFPGMYDTYGNVMGYGLGGGMSGQMASQMGQNGELYNYWMNQGPLASGGANSQEAINRMMSGNLDLDLFQGAVDEYLQPAMEQFNEQLLPSFLRADAAAASGQSTAGALKAAQRTQEQIGEGLGAYLGGRLYDASQAGANRVGQGVGLQHGYDALNASNYNSYLGNLFSGTGLGAQLANAADSNIARYAGMMPQYMLTGGMGADFLGKAGSGQRLLDDPYARHANQADTYNSRLPFEMMGNYLTMAQGGTPATSAYGNPTAPNNGYNLGAGLLAVLGQDWDFLGGNKSGYDPNGMVGYGNVFG